MSILMKMMVNDLQCTYQYLSKVEQSEIAPSDNLDSFNAVILKYQDVMFRTARRILEQDDLADDATQEAFISAYQHINYLHGGSLKAWLIRIVVNKCYDQLRRVQRTAALSLSGSMPDDRENEGFYIRLQHHAHSVEECIETSERNKYIQECLSKLPADYRIIIVLIDIEEISYSEASTILKIPIGTVKSRLARARFSLRQKLRAVKNSERRMA